MSFREQITEHYDDLYAFCLNRVGDQADAEDLTHDTIEKALKYEDTYTESDRMLSWLCMIARNTQISQYRRQKRMAGLREEFACEFDPDQATTEQPVKQRDKVRALVKHAREGIPEPYRSTIMAFARGEKYQEIADEMDVALGTVMSRIYRGRRIARRKIEW